MPSKFRAIPLAQPGPGHLHLGMRSYDMAHQKRLEERACREACELRDHKLQHVGKAERLQRIEGPATCQPAQAGQLVPARRDGSRPHDECGRLDSVA